MIHEKIESQIITVSAPSSVLNSVLLGRISVLLDTLPHVQLELVSTASAPDHDRPAIKVSLGQTDAGAKDHIHCGVMSFSLYLPRNVERPNGWVGCMSPRKHGSFSEKTETYARDVFGAAPRLRTASLPSKIEAMKVYALAGILPDTAGRLNPDLMRYETGLRELLIDVWVSSSLRNVPQDMTAATTDWIKACVSETQWLSGPDLAIIA